MMCHPHPTLSWGAAQSPSSSPQTLPCPSFALASCPSRGEAGVPSPRTCSGGHFKSLLSCVHWGSTPGSRKHVSPVARQRGGAWEQVPPQPCPGDRPCAGLLRPPHLLFPPHPPPRCRFRDPQEVETKAKAPWVGGRSPGRARETLGRAAPCPLLSQAGAAGWPRAPELRDSRSVPLPGPDPAPHPSRPPPTPGPGWAGLSLWATRAG